MFIMYNNRTSECLIETKSGYYNMTVGLGDTIFKKVTVDEYTVGIIDKIKGVMKGREKKRMMIMGVEVVIMGGEE